MNEKIGIRFCGGCNPRINRTAIAETVRKKLEARGFSVVYNSPEADFLIYLNGCSVACTKRVKEDLAKEVWVAAMMVDHMEKSSEDEIVQEILLRVRDYFEGLAK